MCQKHHPHRAERSQRIGQLRKTKRPDAALAPGLFALRVASLLVLVRGVAACIAEREAVDMLELQTCEPRDRVVLVADVLEVRAGSGCSALGVNDQSLRCSEKVLIVRIRLRKSRIDGSLQLIDRRPIGLLGLNHQFHQVRKQHIEAVVVGIRDRLSRTAQPFPSLSDRISGRHSQLRLLLQRLLQAEQIVLVICEPMLCCDEDVSIVEDSADGAGDRFSLLFGEQLVLVRDKHSECLKGLGCVGEHPVGELLGLRSWKSG